MTERAQRAKRPSKKQTAAESEGRGTTASGRPIRASSHEGFRDVTTVVNTDPAFHYRWVRDVEDNGRRLFNLQSLGWEFVDATKETRLGVGESGVHKPQNKTMGSIYRIPAGGDGGFLYLMRIPKDLMEDVEDWKEGERKGKEASLFNPHREEEGQYMKDSTERWSDLRKRRVSD